MKPTVNHENKAKIGDIIELNCILYRIEAIRWVKKQWHKGRQVNQQMTLNRLVDGKTAYLPRGIVGTDGWIIETPEELIGVDVK